jgi:cytochrome c553
MEKRHLSAVTFIAVLAGSLLAAGLAAAQQKSLPGTGDEPVPQAYLDKMTRLCEDCHGPGGVSNRDEVPSLAGRSADELMAELERFYFYERHCPDVTAGEQAEGAGISSMCDMTNQMSRSEALALSNYFASASR